LPEARLDRFLFKVTIGCRREGRATARHGASNTMARGLPVRAVGPPAG
jgi:hypothetical protein